MINYERIQMEQVEHPERFTGDTAFLDDAVAYATGKVWEVMGGFCAQPSRCQQYQLNV